MVAIPACQCRDGSLSALSTATSIITFVDFGAKLVSQYSDIKNSQDGRHTALSALETELGELSANATHARDKVAALQARYPHQSGSLARLSAECALAEKQLRGVVGAVTAKPGHGLRVWRANASASLHSVLKRGDIEDLQSRLRMIREQTMMCVIMCIS